MVDIRAHKFAQILVDYSADVKPGDLVAIRATPLAEPVIRELFKLTLERGAYPHLLLEMPDQFELLEAHASDELLDFVPKFHQMAFEEFDVLFKVRSYENTRGLSKVDPTRFVRAQKTEAKLLRAQTRRGADRSLRWMSTIYPGLAYAMEAEMSLESYQDYFYRACHADENTSDPVAYWQNVKQDQEKIIQKVQGHDKVELRGPNVDLTLSVKDRIFVNACGQSNLPDGEIFTGPVEDSANGWVRYTYPAIYNGLVVDGVELTFESGKVVKATAQKNQDFLLRMLDSDPGARYLGEFAIGLNFEIDRFTGSILLDEKIGGSFHMALGSAYPETLGKNRSSIHWDMICDMREDSEILLDGELFYQNGQVLSS